MYYDSYRHRGMRRRLVDLLRHQGIQDERILDAINQVPRHFFFEKAFVEKAYENKAFPIGESQTISQPYTVAYQTQLLRIKKGEKVLEIGTGSGYQAGILAVMGARIVTIERNQKLYLRAKKLLSVLTKRPIITLFGDGYHGAPNYGPFDKIIVTAAAPYVPPILIDQLKIGGIMVIPVGNNQVQNMLKITKTSETDYHKEVRQEFRFVPMLKGEKI